MSQPPYSGPPYSGPPYSDSGQQTYPGQFPPGGYPPPGYPAPGYPAPPPPPPRSSGGGIVVVIVVAVIALAVIGGGIFAIYEFTKDDDQPSNASDRTAATASPSQQAQAGITSVVGTWRGTYTCAQGLTALSLTIREGPGTNDVVEATFSFSPHPSNPAAKTGSFTMRGSYDGGVLQLFGTEWIEQPAGYETVDLRADVAPGDRPTRIEGDVVDGTDSCGSFSVERAAS